MSAAEVEKIPATVVELLRGRYDQADKQGKLDLMKFLGERVF